ncbi:MAG: hypothetical protein BWZ02_01900 [Lentisphaerae bacterium ADurb.BinA184]|nr:MAG: hypothetical protein BWZ02_01900 [Lentisphaerae bacterium ADurb.BinA184]
MAGDGAGNGQLIIDNGDRFTEMTTAIPDGGTWTVPDLLVRNAGTLGVASGETLILTGPVSTDSDSATDGIRLRGGTLSAGGAGLTIENWSLTADGTNSVSEDITVKSGGAITHFYNTTSQVHTMDLTIDGDLTVENGGAVTAVGKGISQKYYGIGAPTSTLRAGGSYGGQGGTSESGSGVVGPTYGSVLAPTGIGSGGGNDVTTPAGGAIHLTVLGDVVLDGTLSASSGTDTNGYRCGGSGGSLWLVAETLSGGGTISANGGDQGSTSGAGGGGRMAVYLTASDSFGGVKFEAFGGPAGSASQRGAAGTIYRETVSDDAGAGDLIIRNFDRIAQGVTHLPPTSPTPAWGDDLSLVSAFLTDGAKLTLTDDLVFAALDMESGTVLDLGGFDLELRVLTINGVSYGFGVYDEGDLGDQVIGAGTVEVIPEPTAVLLLALGVLPLARRGRRA